MTAPNFEVSVRVADDRAREYTLRVTVGKGSAAETIAAREMHHVQAPVEYIWRGLRGSVVDYLAEALLPRQPATRYCNVTHSGIGKPPSITLSVVYGGRLFEENCCIPFGLRAPTSHGETEHIIRSMASAIARRIINEYCPLDLFKDI